MTSCPSLSLLCTNKLGEHSCRFLVPLFLIFKSICWSRAVIMFANEWVLLELQICTGWLKLCLTQVLTIIPMLESSVSWSTTLLHVHDRLIPVMRYFQSLWRALSSSLPVLDLLARLPRPCYFHTQSDNAPIIPRYLTMTSTNQLQHGGCGSESDSSGESKHFTVTRIYSDEDGQSRFGSFKIRMEGSGNVCMVMKTARRKVASCVWPLVRPWIWVVVHTITTAL